MNTIKAIETEWNGVKFRSRLEARWAILLTELGVKWRYEPEGYQLESGWYVPDFYLPEGRCWLELKGVEPSDTEKRLCQDLARELDETVFLIVGPPDGQVPDAKRTSGVCFLWERHGPVEEHRKEGLGLLYLVAKHKELFMRCIRPLPGRSEILMGAIEKATKHRFWDPPKKRRQKSPEAKAEAARIRNECQKALAEIRAERARKQEEMQKGGR